MKEMTYETCPFCDHENEYNHDVEKDGYKVICSNCGKPIMLCSACQERNNKCDWHEDSNGNSICYRCK